MLILYSHPVLCQHNVSPTTMIANQALERERRFSGVMAWGEGGHEVIYRIRQVGVQPGLEKIADVHSGGCYKSRFKSKRAGTSESQWSFRWVSSEPRSSFGALDIETAGFKLRLPVCRSSSHGSMCSAKPSLFSITNPH